MLPEHIELIEEGDILQTEKTRNKMKLRMQYEISNLKGRKQILSDHSSGILDPFYGNQCIFFIRTKCFLHEKRTHLKCFMCDAK